MRYLVSICLVFLLGSSNAALITKDVQSIDLSNSNLEILEDETSTLKIADIGNPNLNLKFTNQQVKIDHVLNLGFSKSSFWIRFSLKSESALQSRYVLEVANFNIDEVDFFDGVNNNASTGSSKQEKGDVIRTRFFDFPLILSSTPHYFYLRVKSDTDLSLPITLYTEKSFQYKTQEDSFLQALYFGEIISLMIYNFFIFVSIRDRRFLIYSVFSFFTCSAIFAGNGFGRLYIWSQAIGFDRISQTLLFCLSAIFSILFSIEFLKTKFLSPLLHKMMLFQINAFSVLFMAYLLSFLTHINISAGNITFYLFAVTLPIPFIVGGLISLKRGNEGVKFYLLAWSVLCVGIIVGSLRPFGIIPTNTYTAYAVQISSSIEMLLLSFSLAQMIQLERKVNSDLQSNVIIMKQQLIDEINHSNSRLEEAVASRTLEIEAAAERNKHIHDQFVRFGALIAHEFRNPLGIIDSQISLIRREFQKKIPINIDRLDVVSSATRRLSALFERWLQGDRLTKELDELNIQPIYITRWIDEFLKNNPLYSLNHCIKVIHADELDVLMVDEELLTIALNNLIENACKFSPIHSQITIQTVQNSSSLGIFVIDQGVGIDESNHKRIFDDYVRVKQETNYPGLGLGLQFVKRIMIAHKGYVTLSSSLGSGSTFELWFPHSRLGDASE